MVIKTVQKITTNPLNVHNRKNVLITSSTFSYYDFVCKLTCVKCMKKLFSKDYTLCICAHIVSNVTINMVSEPKLHYGFLPVAYIIF